MSPQLNRARRQTCCCSRCRDQSAHTQRAECVCVCSFSHLRARYHSSIESSATLACSNIRLDAARSAVHTRTQLSDSTSNRSDAKQTIHSNLIGPDSIRTGPKISSRLIPMQDSCVKYWQIELACANNRTCDRSIGQLKAEQPAHATSGR